MDDSDQDFVDLCSKLLKRVRKKPGEPRQPRKAEHQPSSQASEGDKRRRNNKGEGDCGSKFAGTQPVCTGAAAEQHVVCGGTGHDSGDAGSSAVPAAVPSAERGLAAKDKVLHRMQQFKRVSPQRLVHKEKSRPTNDCVPPPPLAQRRGGMMVFLAQIDSMLYCCPVDREHSVIISDCIEAQMNQYHDISKNVL